MAKILSALLAALVVAFIFSIGGQVEGYLAPVANRTTFTSIEPVGETYTRLSGQSLKRRGCDFEGVKFRTALGTGAAVIFEEGTKDRGAGHFDFGPWVVQLTPLQLETAEVTVSHRCHPFWLTETRWYP